MSNIAIQAENLGKKYKIGLLKQRHNTLRDHVVHGVHSLFSFSGRQLTPDAEKSVSSDTIWALKDVGFEVRQGDVLGIIGRNGAGKSTLLKILSRITSPTEGRVEINGRVGSLLEVGTGFHSELTGRENVYLSGAILGMKKEEIVRKFDEIVAFAEVEQFIDTPVKRYSSGMYMRLAFAVAAHLEPEVLIVDEVLAVGDADFQGKCIGKMGDVAHEGRTVLFVSHNTGAISNLCTTGMWLKNGRVELTGKISDVLGAYTKSLSAAGPAVTRSSRRTGAWKRTGDTVAYITKARLYDTTGRDCTSFSMGESIILEFDVKFYRSFPTVKLTLEINRIEMNMNVLHLQNDDCGLVVQSVSEGERRFRVEIPNCLLYPTSYEISVCVWTPGSILDYVEGVVSFSMVQSNVTKRTSTLSIHKQAIFYTPSIWKELPSEA